MALFRKNIWSLYIFSLIISAIIFVVGVKWVYNNTIEEVRRDQTLQVELFANSAQSLFLNQETLLEVVGRYILEQGSFTRTASLQIRPILDRLREIHPAIAGFGLINPNGDMIAVSSNIELGSAPNLLKTPQTKDSFLEALASDIMVIGRTYLFKPTGTYIIPLRLALRDSNDSVIAVMTLGITIHHSQAFSKILHTHPSNRVVLLKDNNYRIFISADDVSPTQYDTPIDTNLHQIVLDQAQRQHGMSEEQLKQSSRTVTVDLRTSGDNSLLSLRYISRFDIWAVSTTEFSYIYNLFYKTSVWLFVLFLIAQFTFYFLVRTVAKAEKATRQKLLHSAHYDHLTSLPNQVHLRHNSHRWLKNKTEPFSLFFVDIDSFKSINDSHGHEFGDKILQHVAQRLSKLSEKHRLIVRKASDEFIILWRETDEIQVTSFGQEIIESIAQPYNINHLNFALSCSVGISRYPHDGNNFDDLMRCADIAMYRSKSVRNVWNLFTPDMQVDFLYRTQVEQRLRQALLNGSIYVVYQPQVDLNDAIYGVEALVRWNDEELGFVTPDTFIPIAEASGQMPILGKKIIERSIKEINKLQKSLGHSFQLSLNISVKQFVQNDFISHLVSTAKQHQFPYQNITLEITENLFIEDLDSFIPLCNQLHELGIRISLDDFGTGYSSLSMLKSISIDELKIDKSFIDNIEHDSQSLNMVKNIIAIGKNFGMTVVAEGVETKEQCHALTGITCDLLQGYYFSRPIPFEELHSFIINYAERDTNDSSSEETATLN